MPTVRGLGSPREIGVSCANTLFQIDVNTWKLLGNYQIKALVLVRDAGRRRRQDRRGDIQRRRELTCLSHGQAGPSHD